MEMNRDSEYPSVMTNSMLYDTWNGRNGTICMTLENQPKGGWILSHEHHLLHGSLQVLMGQVISINVIYMGVYYALKPLKQTKFVCSVLAGIILKIIVGNMPEMKRLFPVEGQILIKTLGFLGITLFIFITAVKMDITMIQRTAKKAFIIGIISLVLPFACVVILILTSKDFDKKKIFPYLLNAGLAVTRLTNTAYAFDEMNLLTSNLAQLVMSSTIVDELFTWITLMIGTLFGIGHPLYSFLCIAAMVSFTIFIIRPILVLIVKKTPQGKSVKRIFILGVFVLALLMSCMTDMIGATHMGALVLGLAVPEGPPLGSDIVRMTELFVMDFMMPFFYIMVGYKVKLNTIINFATEARDLKIFIITVVLSFTTKFIGGVLGALASKLSSKHALLVGLMVNLKGPMDLFLFYRVSKIGDINEGCYTILVLSHIILTAIVTAHIDILYKPCDNTMSAYDSLRELQTNPIMGEIRILCCVHHYQDITILLPFLEASNPTSNSPTAAYVARLNNLDGRSVPVISRDDEKIRRVNSNRLDQIAFEFEKYASESKGLVTTKMYTMIAPYKSMHHHIVTLAQEENIALIVSPFHKNYAALKANEVGEVCMFNKNLLNVSPCTVGILVDKGTFTTSVDSFLFSIGVLFLGGADDREAVTLATRMLGNHSVNVKLVRLQVSNYYNNHGKNDIEAKIDEKVIHDFRLKSEKKQNGEYCEIKVETIEELLDGIRALGSTHNLILVGRQRYVTMSMFDEAMLEWIEHRELGALGDFVASADFYEGNTSVLVMQRYNINIDEHGNV